VSVLAFFTMFATVDPELAGQFVHGHPRAVSRYEIVDLGHAQAAVADGTRPFGLVHRRSERHVKNASEMFGLFSRVRIRRQEPDE
jgi:hypothetical protein